MPDLDCSNTVTLVGKIADEQRATASLCVDFTSTYAAYTKNLSYPQQTGLQQWIDNFSAASLAVIDLQMSSEACAYQKSAGISQGTSALVSARADGDGVSAIQIGCGTSMVTFDPPDCTGAGALFISNFQLQSDISVVCAATRDNELAITTPEAPTGNPIKQSEIVVTSPTVVVGTTSKSELVPVQNSGPAAGAGPESAVPTVTRQARPDSRTSAIQPDVTAVLIAGPNLSTQGSATPAGRLQPSAQTVTFPITDSNGKVQTVTATAAVVPVADNYVTTKANGEVQTIVPTADSTFAGAYMYVSTGPNGQIRTVVTQISDGSGPQQTVVITNSLGQTETFVVPASALKPTMTTYTTTDTRGQIQVVTASTYAIAGPLVTYKTTDARGQAETVVSQMSSTANHPATPTSKPSFVISSQEKIVKTKFTYGTYVLALYLPALLAVIAKATWEMVFSAIKLIQPFERMASAPTSGEHSIFAQYLSSSLSWDAFTSLAQGNPVPFLASVLYVLVTLGAPVAAASMTVKARSYCDINGVQRRCDPVWVVNVVLLRGVEAALGISFGLVLLILRSVARNKSGVACDPSSLASLASLMNHEPLLSDIQRVGPDADFATFKHAMAKHQFLLEDHRTSQGDLVYGIIGLRNTKSEFDSIGMDRNRSSLNTYLSSVNRQYDYHSIPNPGISSSPSSSANVRTAFLNLPFNHLLNDILGLLLPLTLFTLILTWYFDNNDDPLNNFFNSNTLWSRFLLVALATLSALHLSHLERVVRITEPFRRLAANSASSLSLGNRPSAVQTTLLISRSGTPYSNLLYCIYLFFNHDILRGRSGRMSFQLIVTITAVLADLNIIAAAGVAFNDAQTWQVYQISSIASITLSAWTVVVYVLVLVWWRRCESVRAVSEDALGVSFGVGTVGGATRWLLSGRDGRGVLEAIAIVKDEAEGRKRKRWDVDTEYRGRGETSAGRSNIWFGKMNVVGAKGVERWGFEMDGNEGGEDRTRINVDVYEKGPDSRARPVEMRVEEVSGEENIPEQQGIWRAGRFPSLSRHHAAQSWRESGEYEGLWNTDGDLGMRRGSGNLLEFPR